MYDGVRCARGQWSSLAVLRAITRTSLAIATLTSGCEGVGTQAGTLVGDYAVRGVLVEDTCGQSGLPATNPLTYSVEIREDHGLGYWLVSKQSNTGSLSSLGAFDFTVSQSMVVSTQLANNNLQPSDFMTLQPDFDLKQTTCAVNITESINGTLRRRDAADGGAAITLANAADAAVSGTDDLTGQDLIMVTPTAGSVCDADLAAFGGAYTALPCDARYVLTGTLTGASSSAAGSSAANSGH